jgi:hypothetical protein
MVIAFIAIMLSPRFEVPLVVPLMRECTRKLTLRHAHMSADIPVVPEERGEERDKGREEERGEEREGKRREERREHRREARARRRGR